MLTYRKLQMQAAELGISAKGTYEKLSKKVQIAKMDALKIKVDKKIEAEKAARQVKLNKHGKTPEQVEKDNNAAAALAACGRL